jgi:hypothetical protein
MTAKAPVSTRNTPLNAEIRCETTVGELELPVECARARRHRALLSMRARVCARDEESVDADVRCGMRGRAAARGTMARRAWRVMSNAF